MNKLVVVLLAFAVACSVGPTEKESTELAFCRPAVAEPLMRGRATFVVIYRARVDSSGIVTDLELAESVGGVESIAECVATWKLGEGWRNQEVSILLQWEHGRGWTRLSFVGQDRKLIVVDQSPRDYREPL